MELNRGPRVVRLSLDDPETLARLVRTGAIWSLPMYWQIAIDAISRGLVPLEECQDVPAQVLEGFRRPA